jgi:hypothetical protein
MMDDEDFVDIEEIDKQDLEIESNNKKSTKRKDPPKQKKDVTTNSAKKAKYVFNSRDKEIIKTAISKYGSSFATIAKEYFSDANPPVGRIDVQNYISNNPHLKDFCKKGTLRILFNFVPPSSVIFLRTDFQNIKELKMKRSRNSTKTPNQSLKLVEKTRSRTKPRTPRQVL